MPAICRYFFASNFFLRHLTLPLRAPSDPKCCLTRTPLAFRTALSKERSSIDLSLYLIADRQTVKNDDKFFSNIGGAVKGGVSAVQLRDQSNDFVAILKTARRLKEILCGSGTSLIINTPYLIEIARAVNAHGVYLEKGFSPSEVRRQLGQRISIGVPLRTMHEISILEHNRDIDYLSVKVFPSKHTNPRGDEAYGIEKLRNIRLLSQRQIVAIGGIGLENAESVYRELHFNDGIAMAGELLRGDHPFITAQKIQAIRRRINAENFNHNKKKDSVL